MTNTWMNKMNQTIIAVILFVFVLLCVLPVFYVIAVSLTPVTETLKRGVILIPYSITFDAYREILSGNGLGSAYQVTIIRTVLGTALNLFFTVITAYPLSRSKLPGRSGFLLYIVFTMLFSGGLIPTYLLIRELHLINTIWVLIVPGLISAFNLVIIKGFFEQLPTELDESAKVDGASEWIILWKIILPLSLPVMATIGLFYAVGHWNAYFDAVIYINDTNLMPLQVVLRNILLNVQLENTDPLNTSTVVSMIAQQMAAVVVATLPILIIYPFVQKHFTKGVLLGSIKG
ncbi:carbohydrate ABC transporter permease [Paenibacillus sp. FSL H7-0714]|uniref:carbohydrate ABC transporter permease n=1 Tax=Paenibacillus sp. FSL H7-0714 TaxID=2954735 RepID=UPI0030F96D3A